MGRKSPYPRECQCGNCPRPPVEGKPYCEYHSANGCPLVSPISGWEPEYNPEEYTNDKALQHSHNCYAYALGVKDPVRTQNCKDNDNCRFAVPGKQRGHPEFSGKLGKFCSDVMARTIADTKATITDFSSKCPVGTSKVFVVTDDKQDFHYYRQSKKGTWDHKPGGTEPTNKDGDGVEIYDPRRASRYYPRASSDEPPLDYRNECGFICVPRTKPIQIAGRRKAHKKTRRMSKRKKSRKHLRN